MRKRERERKGVRGKTIAKYVLGTESQVSQTQPLPFSTWCQFPPEWDSTNRPFMNSRYFILGAFGKQNMCICPLKTHSLLYSLRMNPKKHESVIQTKYNQFRKRIAIRKHNRRRVGIELFTKTLKFIIRDFDLVTFTIWHFGQFYRTAAPTSSHSARGEQPGSDLVQNRKWWSLWPNLILETFHCVFHFDWTNRTTWCFKIDSFMSLTMIPSLHSSLFHFCQTRCLTYSLTKSTNESKWHTMRKDQDKIK